MRHLLFSCCLFSCYLGSSAQTGSLTRSDSLDLLHTRIDLDLRTVLSGTIKGTASITLTPKVADVTVLPLDLLALTTDSVSMNGAPLGFTHTGEELLVQLGGSYGPEDTLTVNVHYQGDPVVDVGGWGGFYTTGNYQYDLGVAFTAVPHSFGRSWFPCFDNFVERCSFEFIVTTSGSRTVFANGRLLEYADLGNGEIRTHWRIDEAIPSYLASVASTNYVAARDTFISSTGAPIPVTLCAKPADTTDMKNSFVHLQDAFDSFERWFGPYRWDRVGYCLTTQGAMEHPTNICYPVSIADGTLAYEETMAHELAHHWFGDLITCRRAEEMYINEGFAEYLSYLFLEDLYGRERYMNKVLDAHHDMIVKAHVLDQGWHALNAVPQEFTYGEHSYRKGADFIHSLRGYLGDSLFAAGFTRVLANNAFTDMSTEELRDSLTVATGYDLSHYFADWIQQPGWAAFEVDSVQSIPAGGAWNTTVFIEQKLRHADHFYVDVPVTLTFEAADGTRWSDPAPVVLGGPTSVVQSQPPFEPRSAFVNADERLSLATSTSSDTLSSNGTFNMQLADAAFVVGLMPAPSPLRIEELWTAPDDHVAEAFAYQLSPDRWWRITGQLAQGAEVGLRLVVDARPTSNTITDPGLVLNAGGVQFVEDSLVVLYRPNAHFAWTAWPEVDINTLGSDNTNGYARLTTVGMALGDYTLAWRKSPTSIHQQPLSSKGWKLYPNPASDQVVLEAPPELQIHDLLLRLQDAEGRVLKEQRIMDQRTRLDLSAIAPQVLFISIARPNGAPALVGSITVLGLR